MQDAYLVLENGRVFAGKRFGAGGETSGELVFTTAMVGYLETLTDPSYFGQIVVQTFPLIGNYGVIPADFESDSPRLAAYVVREWCDAPSNFRSEGNLDAYLKSVGVAGLYGVDTRALTRILRSCGTMRARISDFPDAAFADAEPKATPVSQVTAKTISTVNPDSAPQHRVALWDFGVKRSIVRALAGRGCAVTIYPADTAAETLLAAKPDGIMLSNGPGNPTLNPGVIAEIAKVAASGIPIFGICLGHQLLALSQGAGTHKLKFGHRGANQPVRDTKTGRIYITSQNHGYAVTAESLPKGMVTSFENANDGTCEGLAYSEFPAFSVQFHPEACAGPLDTAFLFDDFIAMMEE